MVSEPSKIDSKEQDTSAFEPKQTAEGDENQQEEREFKPSSRAELPINHPTDMSNQTSEAVNSSSKPSWWRLMGGEQLSPLERENQKLQNRVEHLTKTLDFKEDEIRELESRVNRLTRTLDSREKEHLEDLAVKDGELAELKKTLCMYDECSEVDIGNMVDGINTRIQSLARNVAVKWVREAKASEGGGDETMISKEHVERLKEVIGVQLVNALSGASLGKTTFAALFLQIAWQASIVAVVKKILSCFSASLSVSQEGYQIENALRAVAGAVQEGEVQPAFGRWRLVTHHYLRQVVRNEDTAIQIYVKEALDLCQTATRLAMKNRCPDDESFESALKPQTKEIVEEAFKLLTTIQEKMVTTNYAPEVRGNGRTFRPEKMTISKQDTEYPNDRVVCTTGLGMLYSGKKGRELSSESTRMHTFRKPEVLTEGNLNDMVAG
ncbi:hypothetical protein M407DRAFT_232735 [Tulasnella calospora MUT 4182]|uniref:Uncharacterized protein n=1 Tax=Tulasnella calospora MUT 4182 TaxID=1051891 RepID=A0A0C3QJV5_9AGAM|nr:hypothetical protein M407DRAFT_232735 [Tulasnella calospora MUT 4182]